MRWGWRGLMEKLSKELADKLKVAILGYEDPKARNNLYEVIDSFTEKTPEPENYFASFQKLVDKLNCSKEELIEHCEKEKKRILKELMEIAEGGKV